MPTILLSILFQEFKRLLHCSSPLTRNNISCPFLPPAYMVRTTGGYVFTGVCLFNFRGGGGGGPHPRSGQGGTTFRVWTGGGGIPHPRSRRGRGGTPQSQLDGVPPGQDWVGYPPSRPGMGYPPPHHDWMRYPLPPPPPSYAAGGVPLAFTQEDFLVMFRFHTTFEGFGNL